MIDACDTGLEDFLAVGYITRPFLSTRHGSPYALRLRSHTAVKAVAPPHLHFSFCVLH